MRYATFGFALLVAISVLSLAQAAEILNLNTNSGVATSGGNVTGWTNSGTAGGTFIPTLAGPTPAPTLVAGPNGTQVINFTGVNSLSDLTFGQTAVPEATVFIVAAVASNTGNYNAFAAGKSSSGDDYASGFNIDQGPGSTGSLSYLNMESNKGNGGQNLLTASSAFGAYHVLEFQIYNGGSANQQLIVDGVTEGHRTGGSSNNTLNLQDLYVGGRHYGGMDRGFFNGNIGAVQIYDGELTPFQQNLIGHNLGLEFGITTAFAPEPSSLLLAALGLVGLFFVGRRAKAAGLKRAVPASVLMIFLAANMASANTLNLNFTSSVPGTIQDASGNGTGLTARLSGTGGSLAAQDPNLVLNTGAGTLSVKATPADLNGQGNLGVGEILGTNLNTLGYVGSGNFSVSATFTNIQYANNYQQFGVFVGTASNDNLRTGPLNCCSDPSHSVYGTYNNGNDITNLISGVPSPNIGDTITVTLARTAGVFSYQQTDVTTPALSGSYTFSGLLIPNSTVNNALNAASNLTVGIYVGNPGEHAAVTETLTNYSVFVATPEPGSLLMSIMAVAGVVGLVCVSRARNS